MTIWQERLISYYFDVIQFGRNGSECFLHTHTLSNQRTNQTLHCMAINRLSQNFQMYLSLVVYCLIIGLFNFHWSLVLIFPHLPTLGTVLLKQVMICWGLFHLLQFCWASTDSSLCTFSVALYFDTPHILSLHPSLSFGAIHSPLQSLQKKETILWHFSQ